MESPELQQRVRSNTDWFLDVCPEQILSPIGRGWLVRFLADAQGCIFWYLYVTPDGSDHAIVPSPGFYGTEAEQWHEEPRDPSEIVYCADSFEAFMCRFWLENEIWLAAYANATMPHFANRPLVPWASKAGLTSGKRAFEGGDGPARLQELKGVMSTATACCQPHPSLR